MPAAIRSNELGNISKNCDKIDSNIALSRFFSVQQSDINVFLVHSVFVVVFNKKKCSCNCAFEFGIPFTHFCAVIIHLRQDPLMYVERYFHTNNCLNSYNESIFLLSITNLIPDTTLPLIARRSRGRPRIARIRAASEN